MSSCCLPVCLAHAEIGGACPLPPVPAPPTLQVNTFGVGDLVRVLDDMESVKRLQASHGEWTDSMAPVSAPCDSALPATPPSLRPRPSCDPALTATPAHPAPAALPLPPAGGSPARWRA